MKESFSFFLKGCAKRLVVFVCVLCAICHHRALAQNRARAHNDGQAIRIGIVSDFSGKMASWGKQTQLGALLAKDDLSAAGIDIELIFEDSALIPARAVSAAQKLMSVDHVDAVYSEFTPVTSAISPMLSKGRVLLVYDAGSDAPLASNPFAFKTFTNFQSGCRLLAEHWKGKGLANVGVLKIEAESGELCLAGVREVYPNPIVLSYNPNEEVRTQILSLKQKGVEAIFNVGYEPDLLNMLKAMEDIDYHPWVGTSENSVGKDLASKSDAFLSRLIVVGLPPVERAFVERVLAKDPRNSKANIEAAALSFTHIKQIAHAAASCSEGGINCKMVSIMKESPDSTIGFKGWQHRQADISLTLRTWRDGKRVAVY